MIHKGEVDQEIKDGLGEKQDQFLISPSLASPGTSCELWQAAEAQGASFSFFICKMEGTPPTGYEAMNV